ncbi:MAG: hypothetical protein OXG81_13925 [Acidobacteria bacterium]|nr:hypothetical protein [Acidobacteriota bacterium]
MPHGPPAGLLRLGRSGPPCRVLPVVGRIATVAVDALWLLRGDPLYARFARTAR